MHSVDAFSSSSSDDEDEEGGWLSQSTFTLGAPPVSARHGSVERAERRPLPLSTSGFDVSLLDIHMLKCLLKLGLRIRSLLNQ